MCIAPRRAKRAARSEGEAIGLRWDVHKSCLGACQTLHPTSHPWAEGYALSPLQPREHSVVLKPALECPCLLLSCYIIHTLALRRPPHPMPSMTRPLSLALVGAHHAVSHSQTRLPCDLPGEGLTRNADASPSAQMAVWPEVTAGRGHKEEWVWFGLVFL